MAHEVENMFYVGKLPWHGLGKQVDDTISISDAIVAAGLDDVIEKVQLSAVEDDCITKVDYFATRRKNARNILGFVGPDYTVLQNKDAFDWFQPFLDNNLCKLHTAGSLCEGRKVWVLASIIADPLEIVKGDYVKQFVMLSNTHDGTQSVRVGLTNVRIVCANTLRMAHSNKSSSLIRVRHSSKVKTNIDDLRETINLAKGDFEATAEKYRYLASRGVNRNDMEKYFRMVLKIEVDTPRKDLATRTQNRLEDLFRLVDTGRGTDIPGVKGTMWNAYNAITENLSWYASRNESNRYDSLWFGPGNELNRVALDTALTFAA
jgi:phage/plasmid-like protein (TIGR03299 family)